MEREFKGVWIDKSIWINKELTWMEKLFITEINSLDGEKGCFASNQYFGKFFQLSEGRCSQIINSLIKKKYLSVKYIYKGKEIQKRVLRILNTGIKNIKRGIKNTKGGYLENAKENNTYINNTINNICDSKESNTQTSKKENSEYKECIDSFFTEYEKRFKHKPGWDGKLGKLLKIDLKRFGKEVLKEIMIIFLSDKCEATASFVNDNKTGHGYNIFHCQLTGLYEFMTEKDRKREKKKKEMEEYRESVKLQRIRRGEGVIL